MKPYMRLPVLVALASALFASATALAAAAPPTSLDVTAKNVEFFSNRFVVTADGDVRVRLSDGTVVTGQTFTMDLKLNRYLVAGDVHVDGPTVHTAGAAFAGYPDLDRSYFLPGAAPPDAAPERWTYYGQDWANPHVGREQPGDAFYFPDLTGERPYIYAAGVRVTPKTNVLFDLPRVYTAGVYLPLPRYVVTFSANSHFYENGFQGARADVALPFNGSEHSLTALHLRNDPFNGTYLALDQHFVWKNDWIVASIDPLTQEQRQYNLIASKWFSPKFQTRVFAQESAAQHGIVNRPDDAAAFVEVQLNAGLAHSGLSYTQDNYFQHLLGYPAHPDDTVLASDYDPRWREHPMNAVLSWTGTEKALVRPTVPLLFRLRSGIGFAHDVYGEGGYPNLQPGPPSLWYKFAGAALYTSAITLPHNFSLTAQYDRQRTWFSEPHHVDAGDARVAVSRAQPLLHINYFVAYEVKTVGDYWGGQQLAAYPVNADVVTNGFGSFGGQAAFRGLATSRALSASFVYTPTPYFALSLLASHNVDYPAPVPGVFGQPPLQLSGDLRVRISKQILVDLSRSYYFNFANERYTPQFGIQVSP
ncbi:MAG TPA: hypothetical protein VGU66_20505 [Candidatus Elarobacter sp.]|nr:hypothetical protein [Candidatus Elarobacter sp.]